MSKDQPVMKFPYWVQSSDLSAEDFAPAGAGEIADKLKQIDWAAAAQKQKELAAAGGENCPAGLGINAPDGRILHICPDQNERCHIDYSFYDKEKMLGLFTRRKYHAGAIENAPLGIAPSLIRAFFENRCSDVKQEIEAQRQA